VSAELYQYGNGDSSYQAAGGLVGLTKLVDAFYGYMDSLPEADVIRKMHSADLTLPRKKLTYFLSGWLGGPRLYSEHFGGINIPAAHAPMPIGHAERDAWMFCMHKDVADQAYEESFETYLIAQLSIPAERVRQACMR
jgi:hemoglobin